jgi:hypothetical protein
MGHAGAVQHGHVNIEQDAIGKLPFAQRLQPLLAIVPRLDPVAGRFQKLRGNFYGVRIVIDDEHVCHL